MKKVCLVPLFGDYDDLKDYNLSEGWEYFVVTDVARNHPKYKDIVVEPKLNNKLETGRVITQPHLYVDADIYCVMGAQMESKIHLDNFIPSKDISLLKHPQVTCTYNEAIACIMLGKGNPHDIYRQVTTYRADGFPEYQGMVATGITVRKNSDEMKIFGEIWFEQILKYSERDQLSFNYTIWKRPDLIEYETKDAWKDIIWHPHKHKA
jgi:hypothetical protein